MTPNAVPSPLVPIPPSAEVLADLARRAADGLSRPVRPPAGRSRLPAVAPAGHPGRRHGPGQDPPGRSSPCARACPTGPFLVVCPAAVKLNWRREIQMVEPDADVHVVASGADWRGRATAGRSSTTTCSARCEAAALAVAWAGVVVDEAHYIKNDCQRAARVLRLLGAGPAKRTGPGPKAALSAHRHAHGQPPARPVQPAQGRPPPAGQQLLRLRQALLRRLRQRLRPGRQRRLQPGGAGAAGRRRHVAPHQGRGPRPAREGPHLAARRGRRRTGPGAWRNGPWTTWTSTRPGAVRPGCGSWACSTGPATPWPWPRRPPPPAWSPTCLEGGQKVGGVHLLHRRGGPLRQGVRRRRRVHHRRALLQPAPGRGRRASRATTRCACWSATSKPPGSAST